MLNPSQISSLASQFQGNLSKVQQSQSIQSQRNISTDTKNPSMSFTQDQINMYQYQQQVMQSQYSQYQMLMTLLPQYDERTNYFQEFLKVCITNDYLVNQVQELFGDKKALMNRINDLEKLVGDQKQPETQYEEEQTVQQQQTKQIISDAAAAAAKKKNRRCAQEIEKGFICPYENCQKGYGSDVSLNLHIKIKHNGGSKTEREKLAKAVMLAKINKDEIPQLDIQFPPGYLENFEELLKKECNLKSTITQSQQSTNISSDNLENSNKSNNNNDNNNNSLNVKRKDSNHLIHSNSKETESSTSCETFNNYQITKKQNVGQSCN